MIPVRSFSATFNAADAVIIPYLKSQRIGSIDRLILSHADRDHSGGAEELVKGFKVAESMVSVEFAQLPGAKYRRQGQQWQWDGVHFEILHPAGEHSGSVNDLSCVLLISTAGGRRTLLPGDIEASGERHLVGAGLPATEILMAPHHGSATSSGAAFVDATRPLHVIYTTGYANRFSFPRNVVTDRYKAIGAREYNTANSGAITFVVSDTSVLRVNEYRPHASGFWGRHRRRAAAAQAAIN